MEKKYIIVRNQKTNRLLAIRGTSLARDHWSIQRDAGYQIADVVETGVIIDGQIIIMDCQVPAHAERRAARVVDNLNQYNRDRILRAREAETRLLYRITPDGD